MCQLNDVILPQADTSIVRSCGHLCIYLRSAYGQFAAPAQHEALLVSQWLVQPKQACTTSTRCQDADQTYQIGPNSIASRCD